MLAGVRSCCPASSRSGRPTRPRGFEDAALLPPPIAPLERRLILTRLIQKWSAEVDRSLLRLSPGVPFMVPATPADAVGLAGDLERLMDALATEDLPWDDIAAAVETDYSRYFEITLRFLRIAADAWPRILAERGASDPARRQSALIRAEAGRLARERPATPIVAAGSTGSLPATAALLAAIARLPNGAVVLPGLDQSLDEPSWNAIGGAAEGHEATDPVHGHPQAMLRQLVDGASALHARPDTSARARRMRPARPAPACSRRPCARPTPPTAGPRCRPMRAASSPKQVALA